MEDSITERYEKIVKYCDLLDDAGYACYKIFSPADITAVEQWEQENSAVLPQALKNWLLLSDGFRMGSSAELLPLKTICPCDLTGFEEYFVVGGFIGDGSMLLADKNGVLYEFDHVNGMEETTFEDFADRWIIQTLEDELFEAGVTQK
ncbi:MAG: hypothetical protein IJ192_10785 [Clostridia bacterium]|nr:hypothetical protein [Clostridia bacterium]